MMKLTEILEGDGYAELREKMSVAIHIDAGWNPDGKTKELIPGLVEIKPDAYVASTIADKISK